jgi:hypothetical protein
MAKENEGYYAWTWKGVHIVIAFPWFATSTNLTEHFQLSTVNAMKAWQVLEDPPQFVYNQMSSTKHIHIVTHLISDTSCHMLMTGPGVSSMEWLLVCTVFKLLQYTVVGRMGIISYICNVLHVFPVFPEHPWCFATLAKDASSTLQLWHVSYDRSSSFDGMRWTLPVTPLVLLR